MNGMNRPLVKQPRRLVINEQKTNTQNKIISIRAGQRTAAQIDWFFIFNLYTQIWLGKYINYRIEESNVFSPSNYYSFEFDWL